MHKCDEKERLRVNEGTFQNHTYIKKNKHGLPQMKKIYYFKLASNIKIWMKNKDILRIGR